MSAEGGGCNLIYQWVNGRATEVSLADVMAPHGGVILWRAIVYSQDQPQDRAKQAYSEFVPLDGTFRENVFLQVKNGPLDFQPREPFHPLFGAMSKT